MTFDKIGSVKNYTDMLALQKKANTRLYDWKKAQAEESARRNAIKKQIKAEVGAISTKLKRGGKLTYTEMLYLQKNAPEVYKKALQIESESKEFAKKLARCKNKDEARALKLHTVSSISCQNPSAVFSGGSEGSESGGSDSFETEGDFRAARISAIVREYYAIGDMRAAKNAENAKKMLKAQRKKAWRA